MGIIIVILLALGAGGYLWSQKSVSTPPNPADESFEALPAPPSDIHVMYPNGGENWTMGEKKEIKWSGHTGPVDIYIR